MEIAIDHLPSKKVLDHLEAGDEGSFPLVMASAAGWYVGQIYKNSDSEYGFIGPWDRLTYYMSKADAIALWEFDWREEWEQVYGGSL